jgi:2-dehydro-3-deoxygalactonokinase
MKQLPEYFISCDWGTTNFRLRLVETASLQIRSEQASDQGVKVLYGKHAAASREERFQIYVQYLEEQIQQLPQAALAQWVVVSGMASSSIGMMELPYAAVPLTFDGTSLLWKDFALRGGRKLVLISGVRSAEGMMRGEEVQAVGLAPYLAEVGEGILILPGTHSKHISFSGGRFSSFQTFMTGELFKIIAEESILSNSVVANDWSAASEKAFLEGCALGLQGKLSARLFSVRAKQLNQQTTLEDNFYYLSGLLIGDEMSYLRGTAQKIVLACPESLFPMCRLALQSAVAEDQLTLLEESALEKALLTGQKKILLSYE